MMNPSDLKSFAISHLAELRTKYGFAASDASTGVYHTLFGRDSLWILIFLIEAAKLQPEPEFLAWVEQAGSDIFQALCEYQGTKEDDCSEEQPGKIIHEYRSSADQREKRLLEMELGFVNGRLYSGFDQTFLFVSAYRLFRSCWPKNRNVMAMWPNVEKALDWIEIYGRTDYDGFFEYRRRNPQNLLNQVWKDSFDSAVTTGVDVPTHPLAWIEVQAYAFRALLDAADLYEICLGNAQRATELRKTAHELSVRTNEEFWMPEESCFAMALSQRRLANGRREQIQMVSSNAAHALWGGIVEPSRQRSMTARLLANDMCTEFGLRTVSSKSQHYAPFTYHRGCVWPFDNAVFALGLLQSGYVREARDISISVSEAISAIGSPIELYIVLDTDVFVQPRINESATLLVRRRDQENRNQAWTAAALILFAALLKDTRDAAGLCD